MIRALILVTGLVAGFSASAQEYGLSLGFNQSTATVDPSSGSSVNGVLGFEGGFNVAFELVPNLRFRSGFLYNQRPFEIKDSLGNKTKVNFGYFDVPVNVQYNFTPTVGVFGGLIIGVKGSDSVTFPSGSTSTVDMKSLYPLIDAGVNFTFEDLIGFDLYLQRGMGEFATMGTASLKDYTTFGLRFIYWL